MGCCNCLDVSEHCHTVAERRCYSLMYRWLHRMARFQCSNMCQVSIREEKSLKAEVAPYDHAAKLHVYLFEGLDHGSTGGFCHLAENIRFVCWCRLILKFSNDLEGQDEHSIKTQCTLEKTASNER